jgi:hypothetical protein
MKEITKKIVFAIFIIACTIPLLLNFVFLVNPTSSLFLGLTFISILMLIFLVLVNLFNLFDLYQYYVLKLSINLNRGRSLHFVNLINLFAGIILINNLMTIELKENSWFLFYWVLLIVFLISSVRIKIENTKKGK